MKLTFCPQIFIKKPMKLTFCPKIFIKKTPIMNSMKKFTNVSVVSIRSKTEGRT